jgi:predicted nucleic acid-binding protein
VYVDAQVIIYSVEHHPAFSPPLLAFWACVRAGDVEAVTSELAILETLVLPLRQGNASLQRAYEQALFGTDLRLSRVSQQVLRQAARLRADVPSLRTPDAIHVATCAMENCVTLLTNDIALARVAGLHVTLLADLSGP